MNLKLQTIIAFFCITVQINFAQTTNYTITCPENTYLGAFGCEDIDGIPPPVNTIEEAMAPPYNIQIEGELPLTTRVTTIDDGILFFCEEDPRVVLLILLCHLMKHIVAILQNFILLKLLLQVMIVLLMNKNKLFLQIK